jgi:hypothetical protein
VEGAPPDGRIGWLPTVAAEPVEGALRETVIVAGAPVRSDPTSGAPIMEPLVPGANVNALG